ncbi:MAG: histidinol phosphate aminotransferase, partial [Peptococcales bacterium]
FDVNSIALLFGYRLLQNPEMIDYLIETQQEGKNFTLKSLEKQNYECRDCRGNYILIRTKLPPKEVEERLMAKKILIKTYNNELLKSYIRVSIGSRKAMSFFLNAFYDVDSV